MSPVWFFVLMLVPAAAASAGTSGPFRITNSADAPRTEVVRLEELWRAGGDDADIFFGNIGGILVDRDGRVYVVDSQAKEISVFSPEGEFLRQLGREGEGPGEYREPHSMVLMPNGNVGVIFEQPPRIICFRASDGQFVEDFRFTEDPDHPFQRLSRVVHRGTSFITYASDFAQDSDGMRITGRVMRFDEAGTFLGQCDSLDFEFSFAKPVVRERYDLMWAVGPDGRVYINRERDYGFTVHGNDCGIEHRFTREYEPVKRSTAELDSLREFYQRVGNMGDAKLELLENARDIAWLSADDAGRLWVLSSRGRLNLPADSLAVFDVFDSRGRLECTVEMKAERGDRDWYHMDRDRFFVVHRETMSLVAFKMPKLTAAEVDLFTR